jgi:hypothetical protein
VNCGASDLHQIYRSQIRRALHRIHRSGSRRSQICRSGRLHRIRSARAAAGLRGSTAASPSTGSASPVPPPARSTGSAEVGVPPTEVEVALRRRSSGQARTGPLLRGREREEGVDRCSGTKGEGRCRSGRKGDGRRRGGGREGAASVEEGKGHCVRGGRWEEGMSRSQGRERAPLRWELERRGASGLWFPHSFIYSYLLVGLSLGQY